MLKLYNTLTRKKEEISTHDNMVKMYSCGPTVYSFAHIGNMRTYIFTDLIRRTIKANDVRIDGVMNITDVGHMTSDEDSGDDKMMVAAKKENKTPWQIAEFYTEYFLNVCLKLNIDLPEHLIKATDTIDEMLKIVKGLLDKGYAYETSSGIYFDIAKFKNYGELSGITQDKRLAGARIEVDEEKHNPADFALWIKAPKEHIMQWDSPWGKGYPGWHIECTAIGTKYLGEDIDLHTGGVDHITVHHENEIAQNNCYFGHPVVKCWTHFEFLQVDGGKMGKSLGNFYTLEDLEKRGFSAIDYKYFIMNAHYKKMQNFTFEALKSSHISLQRIYGLLNKHKNGNNHTELEVLANFRQKVLDEINNDLNFPNAISVLWEILKMPESPDIYNFVMDIDDVFGLDLLNYQNYIDTQEPTEIPLDIQELAEQRWLAKKDKNYELADLIRKDIAERGFVIVDNANGYDINVK